MAGRRSRTERGAGLQGKASWRDLSADKASVHCLVSLSSPCRVFFIFNLWV